MYSCLCICCIFKELLFIVIKTKHILKVQLRPFDCYQILKMVIYMYIMLHLIFPPHLGILPPPQNFTMSISNNSAHISWVAPESLQVSTPPTISHYVLSNNLTNGTKTFNNPSTCNTMASCNYSLGLRDPFFITDGNGNTTMLDYNGAVNFTLFSVNGAGNGSVATCTSQLQRKTLPAGCKCTVCMVAEFEL